jgi:hypothetical protein
MGRHARVAAWTTAPTGRPCRRPGGPRPQTSLGCLPGDVIVTAARHLVRAAIVKVGLAEDEETGRYQDLADARALITALAGLVTAGAPLVGTAQRAQLREGLRELQLAYRDACAIPDRPGEGPGERWTGPVLARSPRADDPEGV